MKKIFLLSLLVFVFPACNPDTVNAAGNNKNTAIIQAQDGKQRQFNVELAITPQQQMRGLMFREKLAEDSGMLFYFPNGGEQSFWMKNTLIPLDLIFLQKDGTISHIHENAIPHDTTRIPSNGLAYGVFEINGGLSKKMGIAVGDRLNHPLFE